MHECSIAMIQVISMDIYAKDLIVRLSYLFVTDMVTNDERSYFSTKKTFNAVHLDLTEAWILRVSGGIYRDNFCCSLFCIPQIVSKRIEIQ